MVMISKGFYLFSILWCTATLAAPVIQPDNEIEVFKRTGSTQSDPTDAYFDITNWPDIAEEDCFVMLCLEDGNLVYQHIWDSGQDEENRKKSGQLLGPFKSLQLAKRHTTQINSDTTSAEEFPWASIYQAPADNPAYVLPATVQQQQYQGGAISAGFTKYKVPYKNWFRIHFQPASKFGKFCTALFSDPQDFSVCDNDTEETVFGTSNVVLANETYEKTKSKNTYIYKHAAGDDKGSVTKRGLESDVANPEVADVPT